MDRGMVNGRSEEPGYKRVQEREREREIHRDWQWMERDRHRDVSGFLCSIIHDYAASSQPRSLYFPYYYYVGVQLLLSPTVHRSTMKSSEPDCLNGTKCG